MLENIDQVREAVDVLIKFVLCDGYELRKTIHG